MSELDEPVTVTWAEIGVGDEVLDKNGKTWRVHEMEPGADQTTVTLTDGDKYPQLLVSPDAKVDRTPAIPEPLADIVAEVIATESATETQARIGLDPRMYPAMDTMTGLQARSHLYLVHEHREVGQVIYQDMLATHARLHEADEASGHPHSHQEG